MSEQRASTPIHNLVQLLTAHGRVQLVVWNIVVALLVGSVAGVVSGGILLAQQRQIDDDRTERELNVARQQAEKAERLENLRFIRDRAEPGYMARPFSFMDLTGMSLTGLNIQGANLYSSNLRDARLAVVEGRGIELAYSELQGTHMNSSDFSGSRLTNVRPDERTYWVASHFVAAEMDDIDFGVADLTSVDFTNAVLNGSDLSQANLTEAILTGVCYDSSTSWPPGLAVPVSNDLGACMKAHAAAMQEARTAD